MKFCKGCSEIKSHTEMIKNCRMSDGYTNFCKICTKAKNHYWNTITTARSYDKTRSTTEKRKQLGTKVTKEYRQKYPERYKATNLVASALKKGTLMKEPCFICGDTKSVAHHSDYSRPLVVTWLCTIHHKETHSLIKMPE